jgi:hypothetical protein
VGCQANRICNLLRRRKVTVRKAQKHAEPPEYTLSEPRPAPVFGPFHAFVDEILTADATAPTSDPANPCRCHWIPPELVMPAI